MKFQGELGLLGFLNRAVGRRAALLADVGDLDHASIEEGPWLARLHILSTPRAKHHRGQL
jgi:hypothetical protein